MANQRQAVAAILRCHAANDAEYLHEHQGSRDARWRRIEAEVLAAFDEERARIRRELEEWLDSRGFGDVVPHDGLRLALDRICPDNG